MAHCFFVSQSHAQQNSLPPPVCTVLAGDGVATVLQTTCGNNYLQQSILASNGGVSGFSGNQLAYYFRIVDSTDETVNLTFNYVAYTLSYAANFNYTTIVDECANSATTSTTLTTAIYTTSTDSTGAITPGGPVYSDVVRAFTPVAGPQCNSKSQDGYLNQAEQTHVIPLSSSTIYAVVIQAYSKAACPSNGVFCFTWNYGDPVLSVDPNSYPNATLQLSDGAGNSMLPAATIYATGQAALAGAVAPPATDGPLPWWAYLLLVGSLTGTAANRLRARA